MDGTVGDVERLERHKRSLLGALSRVDIGSLLIPTRRSTRVGERLPLIDTDALSAPVLAAVFAGELGEGG